MSSANLASLNNNKPAAEPAQRGAGVKGTTAAVTAVVVKDQALPTVPAIATTIVRNGGYVAPTQSAIAPPTSGVNPYGK
jgi:hypothetical protein